MPLHGECHGVGFESMGGEFGLITAAGNLLLFGWMSVEVFRCGRKVR